VLKVLVYYDENGPDLRDFPEEELLPFRLIMNGDLLVVPPYTCQFQGVECEVSEALALERLPEALRGLCHYVYVEDQKVGPEHNLHITQMHFSGMTLDAYETMIDALRRLQHTS
jgi:hypothetical protein